EHSPACQCHHDPEDSPFHPGIRSADRTARQRTS
ncbi:MAG: Mobile element protein, partial [Olavius algarvensis Gamma 1 endosymbiont]